MGGLGSPPAELAPPRTASGWVLPAEATPARPVWGLSQGLRVSIWPACERRGALCVHAPQLELEPHVVLAELVLEAEARGRRARSDAAPEGAAPALRPLSAAAAEEALAAPWRPPVLEPAGAGAGARLSLRLRAGTPLANGVRPELRVTLRRDRPYALELEVRSAPGSARPERVALVAERAAFARLRTLWLEGRAAGVATLWPELSDDGASTASGAERRFERAELEERDAALRITAVPDALLGVGAPEEGAGAVPAAWRYPGAPSLQYLRTPAGAGVAARAAPAIRFPGTDTAIPGGPALRSFALEAPFGEEGVAFVYGAEPR